MIYDEIVKNLHNIKHQIKRYKKGEILFFSGSEVLGLYLITNGTLTAEMIKNSGSTRKIEDLSVGNILASAFIFGKNSCFPVDIMAKTDCEIIFIRKDELIDLFTRNKNLMVQFLTLISQKAQFLSRNLKESIENKTINQKLAIYILENQKDGVVKFKETLKELSQLFNVSRPSLSRVIQELVATECLTRLGRGVYEINDMDYFEFLND